MSSVHPNPETTEPTSSSPNKMPSDSNNKREVQVVVEKDVLFRETEGEGTSVTAAEPLEDDHESIHDAAIPTFRLSSLGVSMESDVQAIRDQFGGRGSSSDFSSDDGGGDADLKDNDKQVDHHDEDDDEHYDQFDHKLKGLDDDLPFKPQRQRLVSEEGVIAEFDLVHKPDENNDDVQIVADPIHIPGPGDESFRSAGCDLELGDAEPLPYPFSQSSRRAASAQGATGTAGGGAMIDPSSSGHRAALISATFIKNSETDYIGFRLKDDSPIIHSIDFEHEDSDDSDDDDDQDDNGETNEEDNANNNNNSASILTDCPFRPGDQVLSINGRRTENMEPGEAARLLQEATGFVTVVVHNLGGHPCLIETLITKQSKNQRSGMGLKSSGNRDLRVSSINENGLFAQSLLNIGDRILSINDVDVTEVDARVACDIIKNSNQHVRVVGRTRHTTGVVVAEVSTRGSSILGGGGGIFASTENNEIEAVDDTCRIFLKKREQWALLFCLLLVVMAVLLGVFLGGKDDDDGKGDNRGRPSSP